MDDCPESPPYEGRDPGSGVSNDERVGMNAPSTLAGSNLQICQAFNVSLWAITWVTGEIRNLRLAIVRWDR